MRVLVSVRRSFFAGHTIVGHSVCEKVHGHDWKVTATLEGGPDPKTGMVVDHGEFEADLAGVCFEFNGRYINELFSPATPEALSGYIREQLILKYPKIVAVEVDNGVAAALTEWPVRP